MNHCKRSEFYCAILQPSETIQCIRLAGKQALQIFVANKRVVLFADYRLA